MVTGWLESDDEVGLYKSEMEQNHKKFYMDIDFKSKGMVFEERRKRLRKWFDQVMPIFLREESASKIRPLPALLGNDQQVDLFKLYWMVQNRGGFDAVSENGWWGVVVRECGYNVGLVGSVKLVYMKYLKNLEVWLEEMFRVKRSEKSDLLIMELGQFRGLGGTSEPHVLDGGESGKVNGNVESIREVEVKFNEGEFYIDLDKVYGYVGSSNVHGTSESHMGDGGESNKVNGNVESLHEVEVKFNEAEFYIDIDKVYGYVESSNVDEKDFCILDDKRFLLTGTSVVDKVISSQKNELCFGAEGQKGQDNVETRKNGDDVNISVQDNYDILLSARSVHKVHGAQKSELFSLAERDNAETSRIDDHGKITVQDDCDVQLSARTVVEKVISSQKSELNSWAAGAINNVNGNAESSNGGDVKMQVQDDANIVSVNSELDKVGITSQKRKWESADLSGMLSWITQVAKQTDDPSVGVIPWKEDHGGEVFWEQALEAREALLIRRPLAEVKKESPLKKKQKMHPSMYEDKSVALHQSTERVRCSKRRPCPKSKFCDCCDPVPAGPIKPTEKAEVKNDSKASAPMMVDISNTSAPGDFKQVSIGSRFQAEIPKWTGMVSESDSKWLGTRIWPPENGKNTKTLIEKNLVGSGRENACDCPFPGSTGCVKFHIVEKRMKLKLELGVVFFRWGFDRMGEEVSLSWTNEEEKRFKTMLIQNSAAKNKFWKKAWRLFPEKTRKELVSYYFNVLVILRRSYQNRETPRNVDSDDDESEFGAVGDSSYYDGNTFRGSK